MDLVLLVCPCGEIIRAFALAFSPPLLSPLVGLLDVTPHVLFLLITPPQGHFSLDCTGMYSFVPPDNNGAQGAS